MDYGTTPDENDPLTWTSFEWETGNMPCINVLVYAIFEDVVEDLPSDSAFIQWLKGASANKSENSEERVSFTLKFKATSIQTTGFKDHKETFAALNGK